MKRLLFVLTFVAIALIALESTTRAAVDGPPMANLNLNASGETDAADDNESQPVVDRVLTTNNNANSVVLDSDETDSQPTNTNVTNTNRSEIIAKLREPAKPLPLLLVVLAAGLYLVYERIGWRKS